MEKTKKKNTHKLEKFHNFFKKHWFWYTIIISSPTIWFSIILPYVGEVLKLVNKQNKLTMVGVILTGLVSGAVVAVTFFNNLYLSKTETGELEKLRGNIEYLKAIMDSVDKICDEKYARLKNKIAEAKNANKQDAQIISDPNNQLKRIIIGVTECLVELLSDDETKYAFKDFFVTIAYNFPKEGSPWRWTEGTVEKDMDLETLLDPRNESTFNHLLKSNKPYYFNNRKEDAKHENRYMYNPQDELSEENGEVVGSIFCYRYQVKKGGEDYIDAMLSISTQKKRFADDEDEACKNVRDNMIALVKDSFGKRIGIELSLLYLEYLQKHENRKYE